MLESEERAVKFLESSVKEFKIFIDTCSLLSEQADKFWSHIVPILQRERKLIYIPLRVYEEVKKYADNPDLCKQKGNPRLNQCAKDMLKKIVRWHREGVVVEIRGDKDDNFADNVFQTVFTKYRLKYNLMLITDDKNLASDILSIGKSKSVTTTNRILVEKINKYGYLSTFQFGGQQVPTGQHPNPPHDPVEQNPIPDDERFALATEVCEVSGRLNVSAVPGEGASLIADRGGVQKSVKLIQEMGSGGEGTVYTTDISGIVAKIYKSKSGKLDCAKFEKLRLMMTKSIDCEGVCFPLAILYNQRNEFVGYLMKQAKGRELRKSVFAPRRVLEKTFPQWTKIDTVTLCVTILKKIKYLHDRNIILGDIQPSNILIVSPSEVYFVDTDSYQIEGFPCPVGLPCFTAPEIQHKDSYSFLRTLGNESFAVATLLFMIMLPGKPPYSLQGGESMIDNIVNGDFAYASGSRSTGKAPEGPWRFCWSHLPRYLKDDFYETFRKNCKHSTEETRFSTGDWLEKFESYLELLTSGKLREQDAMSLDIFPSRLKKNPKATYIRCNICGNEVDEDWTQQGICQDCLGKGDTYHCAGCGCEMIHTNFQKHIKHSSRYKICKDCFNKKNEVYTERYCSECGERFEITNGEKEYFDKKGFQLPKRCEDCRGSYNQLDDYDDDDDDDDDDYDDRKPSIGVVTPNIGSMLRRFLW